MTRRVLFGVVVLTVGAALAQEKDAEVPALDARKVIGAPRSPPLSGSVLERRTIEVASLLRCPVCQGLSVADSPSSMATNMKKQVRDLLAQGYDEEQVLAHFERSYGEFVRLRPPLRGINWIVWIAPVLGLVGGAAFVLHWLRRSAVEEPPPAPRNDAPGRDSLPDDPQLARYVLKVREQAYGWPGGVSPTGGPS